MKKVVRRSSQIHYLKTWPEYFEHLWSGSKTFEVRLNDRNFQPGDYLVLQEYLSDAGYTGRSVHAVAGYILPGSMFGVAEQYCVISLVTMNNVDMRHSHGEESDECQK